MAEPLTITDIVGYNSTMNIEVSRITTAVNNGEIPAAQATAFFESISGQKMRPIRAKDGQILSWVVDETATVTTTNAINSSASTVARGALSSPVSTSVNAGTGAATATRAAGVGTKVATFASKLAVPLTLASIGITLGKTIDETLYNANPQYWDSIGMSTLNPQTWSSLVGGDGTVAGSFFNAIFGIDPATGESQAYVDANALAYCAYVMQQAGIFNGSESVDPVVSGITVPNPLYCADIEFTEQYSFSTGSTIVKGTPIYQISANQNWGFIAHTYTYDTFAGLPFRVVFIRTNSQPNEVFPYFVYMGEGAPPSSIYGGGYQINMSTQKIASGSASSQSRQSATYNSKTVYFYPALGSSTTVSNSGWSICPYTQPGTGSTINDMVGRCMWAVRYNESVYNPDVAGIGNQQGATTPDFTGLSESDYLPYLQQQYPGMFSNAIDYPVMQDDGTVSNKVYIPITLPDTSNATDSQPVSGDQSQASPSINPDTATQTLIDLLTKLLQQPKEDTVTDDITPPENPTDTGDGSSPTPVVPVGSASSLWKIYHPTQAQVDSFGGWLWSSNFVDQILKVFNNPMEAIIGLHKVYATPVDAGNTTIKVGYLDSEVPSAYIEQQYINVSCGSVNLYEQFGNVFDYSPFTDVQLYLPFIGIVPLNVADVMRSTISINYGVDVLTGACLAQVEISRDGNSSILYQYSGNCAVQYPISSGSYMGIVSSLISVAGGVAATVASGGAAAPLALGAAGGIMNAHTSVQHSGSFTGNAGAMGCKTPYLIITRPQTKVADNAEIMQGYTTNSYVTVGDCTGYIKADSVHVINVNATDEELNQINDLLLSGIII